VIVVSNEVGFGIVPAARVGRRFRDLQGWANQILAEEAATVMLVVAGLPLALKGAGASHSSGAVTTSAPSSSPARPRPRC
jgi:hypothetical protein